MTLLAGTRVKIVRLSDGSGLTGTLRAGHLDKIGVVTSEYNDRRWVGMKIGTEFVIAPCGCVEVESDGVEIPTHDLGGEG